MNMTELYFGAGILLNQLLKKEWTDQGHFLTGTFDESLFTERTRNGTQYILSGYAVKYAKIVNEGIDPDKITDKMLPGLYQYFLKRGLGPGDAARAARATIHKWKTEGMSTQASKRFSQTGARHHFIESAFTSPKIDNYMNNGFDLMIDEQYHKTKSETI